MTDKTGQNRSALFDFWKNIPLIKIIGVETFNMIANHHIRDAIVQVLRRGIIDEKTGKRRYALSLKELQPKIQEYIHKENKQQSEIKLTALYHHRDKLLEPEVGTPVIQEVVTYLEGKRYVTYYGRTARAFIGDSHTAEKTRKNLDLLSTILRELNPDVSEVDVDDTISKLGNHLEENHLATINWIEDHVELINRLDLDAIRLYEILSNYIQLKPLSPEIENKFRSLLGV